MADRPAFSSLRQIYSSPANLKEDLSLDNALRTASEDPQFALALLKTPEKFAEAYNLSARQVEVIKAAGSAIDIDKIAGSVQAID